MWQSQLHDLVHYVKDFFEKRERSCVVVSWDRMTSIFVLYAGFQKAVAYIDKELSENDCD